MRSGRKTSLLVTGIVAVSPLMAAPAPGKDLNVLSRLLVPAYTAMNFAAVCASVPGWSATQPSGPRGFAGNYAEHVKDEIIAGLSHDEAVAVLRGAADAAREEARRQLRLFARADDYHSQVLRWCSGAAREAIRAFIRDHDRDHDAFVTEVARAKKADEI